MQRDRSDYPSSRRTVGPEGWRLRRAHMARGVISLAVVVMLTAMLPRPGEAQPVPPIQVQEFCWSLNPFVDSLLVNMIQGLEAEVVPLNGRWRANATPGQQAVGGAGPAAYQLLGTGSATTSVTFPNSFEMGFQAVHNTTFFEGNFGCNLYAVFDNLSLNGTWQVECPGPNLFTAQGTLTRVDPCPGNF
jgi:hypothetical protein